MDDSRLVKSAVKQIHKCKQEGDLLMDVEKDVTWDELERIAKDRDKWRKKVKQLRCDARGVEWRESRARMKDHRREVAEKKPKQLP